MAEATEFLSLTELEGMEDEVLEGFNPEADANALPPPVQPGTYLVKLRHMQEDESMYWESKKTRLGSKMPNKPYFTTTLIGEVLDNPVNHADAVGRSLIINNVMTLVQPRGTSGVQAVLQALGKGPELMNGLQTASRHARLLSQALAEEPMVGVVWDWEADWYVDGEDLHERKRGAKHFTKGEDGKYSTALEIDGLQANVRGFVRRYVTADSLLNKKQVGDKVEEAEAPKSAPAPAAKAPTPAPAPAPRKAPGKR